MTYAPLIEGFIISISLIVAIGPQNAYVLRQGLRHRHVFVVTTVTALSDLLMITLGVMGVGRFVSGNPLLSQVLGWGGVIFLLWFSLRSFRSALKPDVIDDRQIEEAAGSAAGRGAQVAALHALAFAWLNPWAYIDTMVLIGGVSSKFAVDTERYLFMIGACAASLVWFYGLGYGAKKAAPLFSQKRTWQLLDAVIGIIILGVAIALINHQLAL